MALLLCLALLWVGLALAQSGESLAPFTNTDVPLYGTPTPINKPTAGPSAKVAPNGTMTMVFRPQFTVPATADEGATLIANIYDPAAIDAQTVCPGYTGLNFKRTVNGLTATLTLAGAHCNVYGNDVDSLNLTVEYQSDSRLAVNIKSTYLDASNWSQQPGRCRPRLVLEQ